MFYYNSNPQPDNMATECSICYEPMDSTSTCKLSCNHAYHSHCMRNWLAQASTCPYCRQQVGAATYTELGIERPVINILISFEFETASPEPPVPAAPVPAVNAPVPFAYRRRQAMINFDIPPLTPRHPSAATQSL